jgi:hypothetical protein
MTRPVTTVTPDGAVAIEVGGGHDYLRRVAAVARDGAGEQAGQDGPGCLWRAGAGQANPADGGDVRADLADPQRDHAGCLCPARPAGAAAGRVCLPGRVLGGRAAGRRVCGISGDRG